MTNQSYILYADDDSDDQAILKECMRRVDPDIQVNCFQHGQLLYQFLEDIDEGSVLPACIILDMNMPIWTGMQTLRALKRHAIFEAIPVFIFSTASTEAEVIEARLLQAEAYLTKPYAQTDLLQVCREFAEYADRPQLKKFVPANPSSAPALHIYP